MKKLLIIIFTCLAMVSCDNNGGKYLAVYQFNVENSSNETRATYDPSENIISWEEGNEIEFEIKLYNYEFTEEVAAPGGSVKKWAKEKNGKLVYTDSTWKTYVKKGDSFKEVEEIELSSNDSNGYVTFRYFFSEPMNITVVWFRTIAFKEGIQKVSVQVPFNEPLGTDDNY